MPDNEQLLLEYNFEEIGQLNFKLPTEEEIESQISQLNIVMSSNSQYFGQSGCNCSLHGGESCNNPPFTS